MSEKRASRKYRTVTEISQQFGLTIGTINTWRQYGLFNERRSREIGHAYLYDPEEVARVIEIRKTYGNRYQKIAPDPTIMTRNEAAEYLTLSHHSVRRYTSAVMGYLTSHPRRINGYMVGVYLRSDVEKFKKQHFWDYISDERKKAYQKMLDAQERRCARCKEVKPFSEYHHKSRGLFGLNYRCIPCDLLVRKKQRRERQEAKRRAAIAQLVTVLSARIEQVEARQQWKLPFSPKVIPVLKRQPMPKDATPPPAAPNQLPEGLLRRWNVIMTGKRDYPRQGFTIVVNADGDWRAVAQGQRLPQGERSMAIYILNDRKWVITPPSVASDKAIDITLYCRELEKRSKQPGSGLPLTVRKP